MALELKNGRLFKRDTENPYIQNYWTRGMAVLLGRLIYNSDTNSWRVEMVDSHGEFVYLGQGFKTEEDAANRLVDSVG